MRLCIFEDVHYRRLLPLAWLRPVYFLRCGMTDLAEKIRSFYQGLTAIYHCRDYLTDTVKENTGAQVNNFESGGYLLINGRVLFGKEIAHRIDLERQNCIYCSEDTEIAAVLPPEHSDLLKKYAGRPLEIRKVFPGIIVEQIDAETIDYPWNLILNNEEILRKDFIRLCSHPEIKGKVYDGAHLVNRKMIHIGENSVIKPGAVLDAEDGPIYIDSGVSIMPNAVIEGPAFIGKNSIIKIGAKIYGGTSAGETCNVGGEVEASIIHSYSNKPHDGFLGHSYLGQWVNIGADTNNSDLKNNYKNVRVTIDGKTIDTGSRFVGLIMGDHSKTGINTMFNTGTVAGISCNIFGAGFPPKYIPSFSWGGCGGFTEYDLEKALETAQHVVSRRKLELSIASKRLISRIFEDTVQERAGFIL